MGADILLFGVLPMADSHALFIEHGINPLLEDLTDAVSLLDVDAQPGDRRAAQEFIRRVFLQAHQAELVSFYPHLLSFSAHDQRLSVVGYRDGEAPDLFSAQYMDSPVALRASECLGEAVAAKDLVEVGNLAISDPGQARWVIAATTVFLAAAGYRWVLFTAGQSLANAFKRLGLKPLPLAEADPTRLPDRGARWGSYYAGHPKVYLGDIHAGLQKLQGLGARRPQLRQLFHTAHRLGLLAAARRFSAGVIAEGF